MARSENASSPANRITLADGRLIQPDDVLGKEIAGTKLAFIEDVGETASLAQYVTGADALVIEATYLEAEVEMARQFGHITAAEAARLALEDQRQAAIPDPRLPPLPREGDHCRSPGYFSGYGCWSEILIGFRSGIKVAK